MLNKLLQRIKPLSLNPSTLAYTNVLAYWERKKQNIITFSFQALLLYH